MKCPECGQTMEEGDPGLSVYRVRPLKRGPQEYHGVQMSMRGRDGGDSGH